MKRAYVPPRRVRKLPAQISHARARENRRAQVERRPPTSSPTPTTALPLQRTIAESADRDAPFLVVVYLADPGDPPTPRFYAGTDDLSRAVALVARLPVRAVVQIDGVIANDNRQPFASKGIPLWQI